MAAVNYEKAGDEASKLEPNSKKAEEYYEKAAGCHFDIGTIHQSEKHFDKAKEAFGKAAELYRKAKKEADAKKMENLILKMNTAHMQTSLDLTSAGTEVEKAHESSEQK